MAYRSWRHQFHAYTMLSVMGLVFPLSVAYLRFANRLPEMHRKVWHGWLQILGVGMIYACAIPLMTMSAGGSSSRVRAAHAAIGILLLAGGIPVVILTRLPAFKTWHKSLARIILLGLVTNVVIGTLVYADATLRTLAIVAAVATIVTSV